MSRRSDRPASTKLYLPNDKSVDALRTLCLLLTCSLPSQGQDAAAILHKVDAHYNHLRSLQAHYTEHYTGMGMDRTETGTLLLKKPGRMRWAYDAPPGKLFILDGKTGWFYTPGDAQAQRMPASKLDDLRSPLRLLLGHTALANELNHPAVTPNPRGFSISGIPQNLNQRISNISLSVDKKGLIYSMRIEEVDGAATSFLFTDVRENLPVADADFRFSPPPNVTIVNSLPPL